eukprot:4960584-Pleurochrysis_carterae.AAC.1
MSLQSPRRIVLFINLRSSAFALSIVPCASSSTVLRDLRRFVICNRFWLFFPHYSLLFLDARFLSSVLSVHRPTFVGGFVEQCGVSLCRILTSSARSRTNPDSYVNEAFAHMTKPVHVLSRRTLCILTKQGFHALTKSLGAAACAQEGLGDPFSTRFVWALGRGKQLDLAAMRQAAEMLTGPEPSKRRMLF